MFSDHRRFHSAQLLVSQQTLRVTPLCVKRANDKENLCNFLLALTILERSSSFIANFALLDDRDDLDDHHCERCVCWYSADLVVVVVFFLFLPYEDWFVLKYNFIILLLQ